MKNHLFLHLFISLFLPTFLFAQISISGGIRPRSEYRHGFITLAHQNEDTAFFTDQRSRINLDFVTKKTTVYLSLQKWVILKFLVLKL
jgi:hypothetical protein